MTYFEKLKDPRWQRRRLEIFQRDHFRCTNSRCESYSKKLQVHHRYYDNDADPWEYPDEALATLCKECHENTERIWKKARISLGDWDWQDLNLLACYAAFISEPSKAVQVLKRFHELETADEEISISVLEPLSMNQ